MSAALFPIGIAAQGVGLGLEGIGRTQGMEAMSEESQRQTAEWMAENARQQKMIEAEMARRKAGLSADAVAPGLMARSNATQGAGALSAGLGLGGAATARTSAALMPASTLAAQGQGEMQTDAQNSAGAGRMGADIRQSKMDQELRARLYEQQLAQQSSSGHTNSSKSSNNQEVARIYQLKDKKKQSADEQS
jgi:hypothetical protein